MNHTMVCVEHLSKRFGDVEAVRDVSFAVQRGECFGLLGPNGAGKSTAIKMMTTLLPVDQGKIEIAGYERSENPTRIREMFGYVPQMLSVDGTLTGYENLLIFGKLYGLPKRERNQRIQEILQLIGLEEAADKMVKSYSGGMIRRLEIGQAILHHPQVLFLDEPTVGLDPVARKSIWSHIEKLQHEQNMTIILTTHYMEEAEALCSRIAIMNRGQIVVLGTIQELRDQMGDPQASMDDLFAYFVGHVEKKEGEMKNVARSRRISKRLG